MAAGIIGFLYGQGVIVMWPEWSAWTWWGLATACLPLFAVPTLYDKWKARQPRAPGAVRAFFKKQWADLIWAAKWAMVIALILVIIAGVRRMAIGINAMFGL
ncbi:MAG: hypothetical protein OXI07_08530 [Gammaproteobacteria bacterium]|nr:hypothetical protein [Gammaproteobacteria bacterium]